MNYLKVFKNQEQIKGYLRGFEGDPDYIIKYPSRKVINLWTNDQYYVCSSESDVRFLSGINFVSIELFCAIDVEMYRWLLSRLRQPS